MRTQMDLGNSSGLIGKYLQDTVLEHGRGVFVPELMNRKTYNEDGVGGAACIYSMVARMIKN